MSIVTKLNHEDVNRLKHNQGVILLDFYAELRGPCKALAPVLEKFASENTNVIVGKVNVDENRNTAAEFGIKGIPTLVLLHNGAEAGRLVGVASQRVIQNLLDGISARSTP